MPSDLEVEEHLRQQQQQERAQRPGVPLSVVGKAGHGAACHAACARCASCAPPLLPLFQDLVLHHHALDEEMVRASPEARCGRARQPGRARAVVAPTTAPCCLHAHTPARPRARAHRSFILGHLTHLHLDRLRLCGPLPAPVLQHMPCLTHVYLQHNQLCGMGGLAALPALRFAALSHNVIQEVRRGRGAEARAVQRRAVPCSGAPGAATHLQLAGSAAWPPWQRACVHAGIEPALATSAAVLLCCCCRCRWRACVACSPSCSSTCRTTCCAAWTRSSCHPQCASSRQACALHARAHPLPRTARASVCTLHARRRGQ